MKKGTQQPTLADEATTVEAKAAPATRKTTKKAATTKANAKTKASTTKATTKKTKAKDTNAKQRAREEAHYETEAKSPKEQHLRDLANVFVTAAKPEVVAARALEDETLYLRFDIDGYELAISVADARLVEGSLTQARKKSKGLRGRYNRIKRPEAFSVDELKERNLPLYWNEQWLRSELNRLGSYSEIARQHNFQSPTTIASYAKRKFGISIQRDFDAKRRAVLEDFETGDYTQLELAEKHGVGVATVYRWLAERKPASGRRGRSVKTPEQRELERLEKEQKAATASA